ncbi:MAG: DNA repair exonuclease [archaeon]
MVKFAHLSDIHLGGWKQKPLQDLNFQSFRKAIEICIKEKVDFILIAGDLFDTPYPPIEILKETFAEFRKIKDSGIPCFLISGSHDYSVSGKTFLDVLEKAGFCKNVSAFSRDEEKDRIILQPTIHNNVAIYGYPGKKSGLDLNDLKKIELAFSENSFKILMLHTTIDKAVGNLPIDFVDSDSLPYADYYALGHIHIRLHHKNFVYPGPLFPNNFAELEELKHGSFCIVNTDEKTEKESHVKYIELPIIGIERINLKINDAITATEEIVSELEKRDIENKIILLRISGELENSRNSDIKFNKIEEFAKKKNAYFMLKNTHDLRTKEMEIEYEIANSENIEEEIIKNYSEQNISDFNKIIINLISSLSIEKQEGETSETFSNRVVSESRKILNF